MHRILVILIILTIAIMLSNNVFAQSLYDRTLYKLGKQTYRPNENSQTNTGTTPDKWPVAMVVNSKSNTIYLLKADADFRSVDSVSVISGENYTKIGEDIPVGRVLSRGTGENDIRINERTNTVYVANEFDDSISVIDGNTHTKRPDDIPVGDNPTAIGVNERTNTVYVANEFDDSISVISGENYTKIGEDIPVGSYPNDIGVSDGTNTVYVANNLNGTVSVISGENNTKIRDIYVPLGGFLKDIEIIKILPYFDLVVVVSSDSLFAFRESGGRETDWGKTGFEYILTDIEVYTHNEKTGIYIAKMNDTISVIPDLFSFSTRGPEISVGKLPISIGVNERTNTVYVANAFDNSVSVIDGNTHTNIGEDIPVGDLPISIGVNERTNTVYVANNDTDGISVIDGVTKKVVEGIIFQVNPPNSGYIECNGLTFPFAKEQYYVESGTQCTARPNEGFEFSSWSENLGRNSTQLISISSPTSYLDSFLEFFHLKSADKPEATLTITEFGNFIANNRELPPPIPSEYLIPLYGIIASTIIGWSIPSIIGWIKSRRDVGKLNYYHKQIASLYGDGKLDENDIEPLDQLRSGVVNAYSEGKINEKHYESLRNEISVLYEKIFRKKIGDSLNDNSTIKKPTQEQLAQIKNEVKYAYSEGKIIEKHYDLLNNDILELESKERRDNK